VATSALIEIHGAPAVSFDHAETQSFAPAGRVLLNGDCAAHVRPVIGARCR
jgi:hypothetical protein